MPATERRPVTETVHGVAIDDPYRWLEDGNDPGVQAWTEHQNAYTRALLDARPERRYFTRRLPEVYAYTLLGSPVLRGRRLFYTRRRPAQNQPELLVRELPTTAERVVLDPNQADTAGLVALDWWRPSPDGRLLAYGYSRGGDEWSTLRVLDVDTGQHLADRIPRTRYASLAWKPDASGFYYTRYPAPGTVPPGEENYHRHVYFHELGTDPEADPKVFGDGRPRHEMPEVTLARDGRYLLITAYDGWVRSQLFVRDEARPQEGFRPLITGLDAIFSNGVFAGDTLYVLTNYQAPNYRIIALDLRHSGEQDWRVVVPPSEVVLGGFDLAGRRLVTRAMRDVCWRLAVHSLDGRLEAEVGFPDLVSVTQVTAEPEDPVAYCLLSAFTGPPSIYRLDVDRAEVAALVTAGSAVDPKAFEVRQVFFPSRDGTRVPMFILHRRGLEFDGQRPTVLNGYGGFNIALTPDFRPSIFPWLEAGGVYAIANLRGGSEYGEDWHRAGMLGNKQSVFDDFIHAAHYLIAAGITSPQRLGIAGGSNGGLLVGAAMTQRPDLFRAVDCAVPLLDMVRYHRFLIAGLWVPEYGDPDQPEHFAWLYAYSPYHRLREGVHYPAVFLHTAASDTRVDPMHARKFAALLQHLRGEAVPVLLRMEYEAGHGAGKPVARVIAEQADAWCFLAWQLGLEV